MFYRKLAERLAESPGVRAQDVMVIVTTAQGDEWSFSGGAPALSLIQASAS